MPKPGTYAKGQSGNPHGRPRKGMAIKDILYKIGVSKKDNKRTTVMEEMIKKVYEMALAGDIAAAKFVANRLEGTPMQHIDHTTAGDKVGGPLFNVVVPSVEVKVITEEMIDKLNGG